MTTHEIPITDLTKAQYLKIWTHYSVGHFTLKQLTELFGVCDKTVQKAIKWAGNNRLQFPTEVLCESAKEALEVRLRTLASDLTAIKGSTTVNWNAYIGLLRVINENEKLLWQLQSVLAGSQVTINNINANISLSDQSEKTNETLKRLPAGHKVALSTLLGAMDESRSISLEDVDTHGVVRIAIGPDEVEDAVFTAEALGVEVGEGIAVEDRARGEA